MSTNSTDTYWDVAGTSLQTYAWNIKTYGSGRDSTPRFRGSNLESAYRRGAEWRAKVADSRTITLAMWVRGVNADGSLPTARSQRAQFTENLRALKALFWKDASAQVNLTKRWEHTDGTIKSATALAEVGGMLDVDVNSPYLGSLVVDLLLADPFFYGAQVSDSCVLATPKVITNAGDAMTHRVSLEFTDALTNPLLTNATPTPDVWVKAGTSVAAADKVTLDTDQYTAIRTSDSANLIGTVTHSGARHWMPLAAGTNTLTLTADSGSGTCVVKHYPAYW